MATALKTLPPTTTTHGPATRRVTVSRFHEGQMVIPAIGAWYRGGKKGAAKEYVVQLSWYDRGDQTYSAPEEFTGTFWACVRWLESRGVHAADIDAA